MSLEKMLEEFKSVAELQTFAEAQYKTIQDLTKKNKDLKDEIKNLKKQLENGVGVPVTNESSSITVLSTGTDEEIIAKVQLAKLKEISYERELTLEETKRTEIFSKILGSFRELENKTPEAEYKKLDDNQILRLLDNGTESNTN